MIRISIEITELSFIVDLDNGLIEIFRANAQKWQKLVSFTYDEFQSIKNCLESLLCVKWKLIVMSLKWIIKIIIN